MKKLAYVGIGLLLFQLGYPRAFAESLEVNFGESHTLFEFLNVHASPVRWISIGGKRYKYVMGRKEPYLKIPGSNRVLFITSNSGQTSYGYHFVSVDDGQDVSIPAQQDSLHLFINRAEIKIEAVEKDRIVVYCTKLFDSETSWRRYTFDLGGKTATETRDK